MGAFLKTSLLSSPLKRQVLSIRLIIIIATSIYYVYIPHFIHEYRFNCNALPYLAPWPCNGWNLVKIEALGTSTQFLLFRHLEMHDIRQVQKKEFIWKFSTWMLASIPPRGFLNSSGQAMILVYYDRMHCQINSSSVIASNLSFWTKSKQFRSVTLGILWFCQSFKEF